jgi:hypothetical protein
LSELESTRKTLEESNAEFKSKAEVLEKQWVSFFGF